MNRLPLLSVIQVLFGFALESQNYPAQILTSLRARLGQLSAAPAPPANHCSELFLLFPTVAATENGSGSSLLCLVSEGAAQSWVLAASCGFKQYRTVVNSSEAGAARSPAKHALKLRERTAAFAVRALRVWLLFGYCSLITVSNKASLEN